MTSNEESPGAGQRELLVSLAQRALVRYGLDLEAAEVVPAASSFNSIFRVAAEGRTYALRVGPAERIHAKSTEIVEAAWMRELRAGGVVLPPTVEYSLQGEAVVHQSHVNVPGERVCMLFEWVEGPPLSEAMGLDTARRMGRLAAQLVESAPAAEDPREPPLVADRVLYWQVEHRLPQLEASGSLLSEALDRAQRTVDEIWTGQRDAPRLIHGDLTPDNILVADGQLVPIDFQDLVWGFDVQDLAISWNSLTRFPDAEALQEQFRAGYSDVRAWPDLDDAALAGLVAARRLHQLNLSLTLRRPGLDQYVERALQLIAKWMA